MTPATQKSPEADLALYLLDLRSEYEAELRLLTEVQRALERFRTARTTAVRARAKEMLTQQLRLLDGANRSIHDALAQAPPKLGALGNLNESTLQ
jgi:hypothetical protein